MREGKGVEKKKKQTKCGGEPRPAGPQGSQLPFTLPLPPHKINALRLSSIIA